MYVLIHVKPYYFLNTVYENIEHEGKVCSDLLKKNHANTKNKILKINC